MPTDKLKKRIETFTLDIRGQCYEIKTLEDGERDIAEYIEREISFYGNGMVPQGYKIKVVLEKE